MNKYREENQKMQFTTIKIICKNFVIKEMCLQNPGQSLMEFAGYAEQSLSSIDPSTGLDTLKMVVK